ncbi:MAG TPA: hypothetical protein VNY30_10410, partial [Bryobacteraceae bacterium]|nr:hypothetical protein [Bryobacteraceae bacterium]
VAVTIRIKQTQQISYDPAMAQNWPRVSIYVYAGFTVGLEAQGIGLLGQAGFFERFTVCFSHTAKQFHIDT